MVEPDTVTEESRDVVCEPLRLPQRRLTSKQTLPFYGTGGKEWSRGPKRARVNVSELVHDAFLAKAARIKEKQWHGLNGREKLLFFEAISRRKTQQQR